MKKCGQIWLALALVSLLAGCGAFRAEPPLPSAAALEEEPLPSAHEIKALKDDMARLQEELTEVKRSHVNALIKMGELYGEIERLGAKLPTEAQVTEPGAEGPLSGEEEGLKDAKAAYNAAFHLYEAGQHADAARMFEAFLTSFPDNPLADNAQYWLGETYFATKAYLQALEAFRQVERLYPKGNKVPDALLKIGIVYAKLGEYDRAESQLEELIERFPSSPLVSRARMEIDRIKAQEP